MKADDRKEFLLDMIKEVTDQINNGNFSLIRREEIPEGRTLIPVLYQMNRKRQIKTRQIKKWKSRINVDVSRMKKRVNCDKLYSPVAGWPSITILLILVSLERLEDYTSGLRSSISTGTH